MSDQGASWQPDPQGKHEHRWWDGSQWTDQVADGGVVSSDPLSPSGPVGSETIAFPAAAATPPAPGAGSGGAVPPPGAPGTPPPGAPVGGAAPPPGAPGGVASGPGGPAYVPPSPATSNRKPWPWILAALAAAAIVVVIVVVASGGGSSFPYTDFDEGECTDDDFSDTDPDEGVGEIDTVDCDEEHTAEAIGQFELEGDDDDYPSADDINEEIEDQCLGDLFEDYVGVEYRESVYLASGLPPGEDAWEDGARTVVCAIYARTDDEDLEGSARDSEE